MTAHAMKGDREVCLEAGMDDYVSKPIRAEQLFAAIDAVIPRSQVKPARPSPPASGVDWSETLRSVQDDPILLASIVDAALEEIPRLMTTIEQAVEERDPTELRLAAHTLKGSLHYFGEAAAVQQASYLEQMGQTSDLHNARRPCRL